MRNKTFNSAAPYQSGLTRRDTLKWLGALSVTSAFPVLTACSDPAPVAEVAGKGHWPELKLAPITASGYGKDPNLIIPPRAPWPLIMSAEQLTLVAVLSDIIVPRDGDVPSATEVKVPEVVNEWVSSPYVGQEQDRLQILSLLSWLNTEAKQRFNRLFVDVQSAEQMAIIDDIAFKTAYSNEQFARPAGAFATLRRVVLAAFFCSPEGTKDLGYLGNTPIAGDYPGPTEEAMAHLNGLLDELGLSL